MNDAERLELVEQAIQASARLRQQAPWSLPCAIEFHKELSIVEMALDRVKSAMKLEPTLVTRSAVGRPHTEEGIDR